MRTVLSTAIGAVAGAGAMYLLDPEHGRARRRETRRTALRQARTTATSTLRRSAAAGRTYAASARSGFADARDS